MAYLNVMERIRKIAQMSALKGGVPDKDHRKCSDWASYTDAVDTVTGEIVSELVACKESYAKLAGSKADMAGRLADMHDALANTDKRRVQSGLRAKGLALGLTPDQREAMEDVVLSE